MANEDAAIRERHHAPLRERRTVLKGQEAKEPANTPCQQRSQMIGNRINRRAISR